MDIKDQVCTFDQAAAIHQEGVWLDNATYFWCKNKKTGENIVVYKDDEISSDYALMFPAPNVAEFGVLLPCEVNDRIHGRAYPVKVYFDLDRDLIKIHGVWLFKQLGKTFKTEAQARAEAYIWILRKNYIIEKGIVLV